MSYTVNDLRNKLEQLQPDLLIELLMYVCDPTPQEIVDAFSELIAENHIEIQEELSEYSDEEGTED